MPAFLKQGESACLTQQFSVVSVLAEVLLKDIFRDPHLESLFRRAISEQLSVLGMQDEPPSAVVERMAYTKEFAACTGPCIHHNGPKGPLG